MYWTFAEFRQHLQNDLAWFTFTCLRTDELKEAQPQVCVLCKCRGSCLLYRVGPFTFKTCWALCKLAGILLLRPQKELSFFKLLHGVHDASQVKDGLSQVMRNMAKLFLLDVPSFSAGFLLKDMPRMLTAKLGIVISDADALKQMFQNKGASGSKPCIRCRTVVC